MAPLYMLSWWGNSGHGCENAISTHFL